MRWQERGSMEEFSIDNKPIYKHRASGLVLYVGEKRVSINVSGIFSLKRRKIIKPEKQTSIYKITIEDLMINSSFLGVEEIFGKEVRETIIFPAIKSLNGLSGKKIKKLLVNTRKNKIEFSITSDGKIVG